MTVRSIALIILIFCADLSAEDKTGSVIAESGLVLRKNPIVHSERLDLIPKGSKITILDSEGPAHEIDGIQSNWFKVEYNGKTGWAFGGYIRTIYDKIPKVQLEKRWESSSLVNCVAFSPDGNFIVSGSSDGKVTLWNTKGSRERTLKGHTGGINYVSFSPDGKYILSASSDTTIKLWETGGNLVLTLKGHKKDAVGALFGLDGTYILSTGLDDCIIYWKLDWKADKDKMISNYHIIAHNDEIKCINRIISFSPDGKTFAISYREKFVNKKISIYASYGLWKMYIGVFKEYDSLFVSYYPKESQRYLIAGNSCQNPQLWRLYEDSSRTGWLRNSPIKSNFPPAEYASFSYSGKYAVSCDLYQIRIWKVENIYDFKSVKIFERNNYYIKRVEFIPGDNYIISRDDLRNIKLWWKEGILLKTFEEYDLPYCDNAVFSPDGKHIITISKGKESAFNLWKIEY